MPRLLTYRIYEIINFCCYGLLTLCNVLCRNTKLIQCIGNKTVFLVLPSNKVPDDLTHKAELRYIESCKGSWEKNKTINTKIIYWKQYCVGLLSVKELFAERDRKTQREGQRETGGAGKRMNMNNLRNWRGWWK